MSSGVRILTLKSGVIRICEFAARLKSCPPEKANGRVSKKRGTGMTGALCPRQ
jgi:hypothetical protein